MGQGIEFHPGKKRIQRKTSLEFSSHSPSKPESRSENGNQKNTPGLKRIRPEENDEACLWRQAWPKHGPCNVCSSDRVAKRRHNDKWVGNASGIFPGIINLKMLLKK